MSAKTQHFLVQVQIGMSEDPSNDIRRYVVVCRTQAEAVRVVKRAMPPGTRVAGVFDVHGEPAIAEEAEVETLDVFRRDGKVTTDGKL